MKLRVVQAQHFETHVVSDDGAVGGCWFGPQHLQLKRGELCHIWCDQPFRFCVWHAKERNGALLAFPSCCRCCNGKRVRAAWGKVLNKVPVHVAVQGGSSVAVDTKDIAQHNAVGAHGCSPRHVDSGFSNQSHDSFVHPRGNCVAGRQERRGKKNRWRKKGESKREMAAAPRGRARRVLQQLAQRRLRATRCFFPPPLVSLSSGNACAWLGMETCCKCCRDLRPLHASGLSAERPAKPSSHRSQRRPVTRSLHTHWPDSASQTVPATVPRASQSQSLQPVRSSAHTHNTQRQTQTRTWCNGTQNKPQGSSRAQG